MRKEANNHQIEMEEMVTKLTASEGLDSSNIRDGKRNGAKSYKDNGNLPWRGS